MKKIVLPILSVGTIVTATMTMVLTSCGATVYLDKYLEGFTELDQGSFFNETPRKLSANKFHTAYISMVIAPDEKIIDNETYWEFMVVCNIHDHEHIKIQEITDARVWIDNKELKKIPYEKYITKPEKDEFTIVSVGSWRLEGGKGNLTEKSQMKIKFRIENNIENASLVFTFRKNQ